MNLHGIVRGAIGAINPFVVATLTPSAGSYTTSASGVRTPVYGTPVQVSAQVQMLTTRDLRQLDSLNIQGSTHKIYMDGNVSAISRPDGKGGDLITLASGAVYLVTSVLEQWPDWVAVSVTLQRS